MDAVLGACCCFYVIFSVPIPVNTRISVEVLFVVVFVVVAFGALYKLI